MDTVLEHFLSKLRIKMSAWKIQGTKADGFGSKHGERGTKESHDPSSFLSADDNLTIKEQVEGEWGAFK